MGRSVSTGVRMFSSSIPKLLAATAFLSIPAQKCQLLQLQAVNRRLTTAAILPFGSSNLCKKSFRDSGIIEEPFSVSSKDLLQEVEFSLGPFFISKERAEVSNFTTGLYMDRQTLITPRPKVQNDVMGFLKPFTFHPYTKLPVASVAQSGG
ncbi:hypothetical protein Pcinc_000817 [Petrolisthes cinctipes]|uniref:Uncharacterized protein n=1 Tax=Petrolisthes cinctipes TaxID=88211 RepID=A0AAE1GP14_PETCI|nr:hypothetical protein Pcinc_000817 [Petrolisthes cinctipes]